MKSPDEKPNPGKDAANTRPSRLTEIRRTIEGYANDLREIIMKPRKHLIEAASV
jgi:hypothetical protein